MRIPTYIINLKTCPERKSYMEKELAPFPYLEMIFVEGVDGRLMTCAEQERVFDQNKAYHRYGRILGCGEVGCTLSHIECCRRIIERTEPYALIVEDDLVLRDRGHLAELFQSLSELIDQPKPMIILLTGDFWYWSKRKIGERYEIAKAYDAVCTGAYLINAEAAKKVCNMERSHIADDWRSIINEGVSLFALIPHIADQERLNFKTTIALPREGHSYRIYRSNMKLFYLVASYWNAIIKKALRTINHFESKDFVW